MSITVNNCVHASNHIHQEVVLTKKKTINDVDDNGDTLSDYDNDKDCGGERFLSVLAVLDEGKNI